MKPMNKGLSRLLHACVYMWQGVTRAWKNEEAFRQELVLAIVLIPVALIVEVSAVEEILLIASLVLVLIVELLNSAIEAVVDRIGAEHHELSGAAKDMGSAAVFFSLLLVIYIWGKILIFNGLFAAM